MAPSCQPRALAAGEALQTPRDCLPDRSRARGKYFVIRGPHSLDLASSILRRKRSGRHARHDLACAGASGPRPQHGERKGRGYRRLAEPPRSVQPAPLSRPFIASARADRSCSGVQELPVSVGDDSAIEVTIARPARRARRKTDSAIRRSSGPSCLAACLVEVAVDPRLMIASNAPAESGRWRGNAGAAIGAWWP